MNDRLDSVICLRPFYALELHIKGDVSACCPAWSKNMVGNTRHKSLREIWNDKPIRHMRQMMLEGRWEKICRPSCPYIMNYLKYNQKVSLADAGSQFMAEEILSAVRSRQIILPTSPTWLNLANSNNCNISCIMCGRENYRENRKLVSKTMSQVMELLPGIREIVLTGNGDPFARSDTRDLMLNLDTACCPDLKISLLTNGLLLPAYWDGIKHLNFGDLDISIDAATSGTYETIRRGASWQQLLKSLELVSSARDRFRNIGINMTVMKENYREIPLFVELAAQYGFSAGINKIRGRWGDQNIFTAGDSKVLEDLNDLVIAAQAKAGELQVPFNCSCFNDVLEGKKMTLTERYRQIAVDNMVQIYYKLKP